MYKMKLDQNQEKETAEKTPVVEATPRAEKEISVEKPLLDESKKVSQNQDPMTKKAQKTFIIICVVAVAAGILTGFGAYKLRNKTAKVVENVTIEEGAKVQNGDVFGVQDKDTFADSATGYIEKGGVDGEGSHRLLREGGDSQTVALTSSVVDLDKLVGTECKIYGETFKADKAGWFMDVGRVEVVDTDAEAPIQTLD